MELIYRGDEDEGGEREQSPKPLCCGSSVEPCWSTGQPAPHGAADRALTVTAPNTHSLSVWTSSSETRIQNRAAVDGDGCNRTERTTGYARETSTVGGYCSACLLWRTSCLKVGGESQRGVRSWDENSLHFPCLPQTSRRGTLESGDIDQWSDLLVVWAQFGVTCCVTTADRRPLLTGSVLSIYPPLFSAPRLSSSPAPPVPAQLSPSFISCLTSIPTACFGKLALRRKEEKKEEEEEEEEGSVI
ncbi:Hypothetical predicted protein [Xyrichtys novacula]|uniref:Uncharacterized protein n=1 Tax=Xyrichtys novacula TaxID=13765 RepID=A0AAV1G2G2_XYRNO|nr:Hypothetical predicted protein [Xyrichtys novacula]